MGKAPFDYREINTETSAFTPSVMHTGANAISYYCRKYLFLEALAVFKWTVPEHWPENRLQYLVVGAGLVSVFDTDRYGLVYDYAAPYGVNVFHQPTHMTIANPCLPTSMRLQIGVDCEVITMRPDWTGIADICAFYGDLMALCLQTMQANLINSRLSYVFMSANKAGAEAFKKMFDRILQGDPAVFVDKDLATSLDKTKPTSWVTFSNDLKQNFIVPELIASWRRIKAAFDTEVGIPNTNTDKKERMTSDEINSNSVETVAKAGLWLDYMQRGCKRVHKHFGLTKADLWVDWRVPPDMMVDATEATPAGRPENNDRGGES